MTKKIVALVLTMAACKQAAKASSDAGAGRVDAGVDAAASVDGAVPIDASAPDTAVEDAGLRCPEYARPTRTGALEARRIDELSGLVSSQRNPGVLWAHNDSGDSARLFAISEAGALLLEVELADVTATDIEDMALGLASDGTSTLYLADIGDNDERRDEVRVYAVAEPLLSEHSDKRISLEASTLRLTYADGPHNAETLLFDPIDPGLWIVTKGISANVYRASLAGPVQKLERVSTLTFPIATGGSISPDGRAILIRGYASASLWLRARGSSIAEAFATTPCRVPLASEEQGEAIAFAADNLGYWTASEGENSILYYYGRTDTE